MIISAFTPQVVTSRAKPYEYDFNLIATVMKSRQDAYNKTFEGLKNLRKQALNIRFLNESAQADIDAKNKKINDYFDSLNNEYGDLADAQVANRYSDLFKEIAQDTDLLGQYRTDVAIQKQIQDVDKLRKSPDPIKAGFHPMHYENYLQGVQSYIKSDYKTEKVQVDPYVPYIDMNKELAVIMRGIPILKTVQEYVDPNGYIVKTTREGRDPLSVQRAAQEYMASKGGPQYRERAKYFFRNTIRDDDDKLFLHGKYLGLIETQIKQLTDSLEQAPDKEGVQARINALNQMKYTPEEYLALDDNTLIDHLTTLETYESLNAYTESYGKQAVSQEIEPDKLLMHRETLAAKLAEAGLDPSQGPAQQPTVETNQTSSPVPTRNEDIMRTVDSTIRTYNHQLSTAYSGEKYHTFYRSYLTTGVEPTEAVVDGRSINLANTIYFKAIKLASDNLRQKGIRDFTKPESVEAAITEAERILSSPQTQNEVALYNEREMIKGRRQAFRSLVERANNSNDPAKFFEEADLNMFFSYTNAIVDPEQWKTPAQKAAAANYRNKVVGYFNQLINQNIRDADRDDKKMEPLTYLKPEFVKGIDRHPDGTVTLYLDESKFGEEKKPGELYYRYIGFNQDGKASFQDVESSITLKIPELDEFALSRNLPFYLTNDVQKFYALSKDRVPVKYELYRNTNNQVLYRIGEADWTTAANNNVEYIISEIQKSIANATVRPQPTQ